MNSEEIPYMLENTPEEFRRVRDLPCPAPDLSTAEAARVAEFDAAPEPPEIVVERVARAIWEADFCAEHVAWENDAEQNREDYRRLAAAAIAALPPSPAEEAVQRVEAVASELEALAWAAADDYEDDLAFAFERSTDRIRAALASPAPAPQEGQR